MGVKRVTTGSSDRAQAVRSQPRGAMLLVLFTLTACGTEIGDECSSDVECGNRRICDRASEGGYCTVSPCTPNSCPANSVCVEFENEQTYCMAVCDSSDDCRDGYRCDRQTAAAPFCRQQ